MTRDGNLTEAKFAAVGWHLDELVQEFEALPFPQVRESVFDLLQTVDALHRAGLCRLLGFIQDHDEGALLARAAEDPIVQALLILYDFLPSDPRTQAESALATIRPYIHSHGGAVEVLDVVEGVVHLRLAGSCDGCPGSTVTLERGIETALREGFPEFAGISVHQPAPAPTPARSMVNFIPLTQIGRSPTTMSQPVSQRPVFRVVAPLQEIPPGTMKEFEVEGVRVLLANVAGEVYAVGGACPGSMAPLGLGAFNPPVVVCPWHNEAFDVRTGKRVDGLPKPILEVLPIAVNGGVISLAVHAPPAARATGDAP